MLYLRDRFDDRKDITIEKVHNSFVRSSNVTAALWKFLTSSLKTTWISWTYSFRKVICPHEGTHASWARRVNEHPAGRPPVNYLPPTSPP